MTCPTQLPPIGQQIFEGVLSAGSWGPWMLAASGRSGSFGEHQAERGTAEISKPSSHFQILEQMHVGWRTFLAYLLLKMLHKSVFSLINLHCYTASASLSLPSLGVSLSCYSRLFPSATLFPWPVLQADFSLTR